MGSHPNSSEHILITGAGGFIGQELVSALLSSKPSIHLTLADVFEPPSPNTSRTTAVKADLTTSAAVDSLLSSQQWKACYLLHGIMSGGAEANLDLGLAVNIDPPSHTRLSTKAPTWCRRGLPFFTKSLRPTRVAGTAVR